ncbi:MAG: hypothetical protein AAGB01_09805 [Cyanobacteria bacterium P01_F01_bin.42]
MTASQPAQLSQSNLGLTEQAEDLSLRETIAFQSVAQEASEDSELEESVTSLLGGISGLLFALSLSFFLQAPLISGFVLLSLLSSWTTRAVLQSGSD